MPRWTTTPENGEHRQATRLIRCRPGRPITGIITSRQMVGCYVHYWRGRTAPCEDSRCEACHDGRVARWYGWFGLWHPQNHDHVLCEITASTVETFAGYVATHGQLRAGLVDLHRANKKENSRLIATIKESTIDQAILPDELDVQATLTKIWETHHTPLDREKFNPEAERASVRIHTNGSR